MICVFATCVPESFHATCALSCGTPFYCDLAFTTYHQAWTAYTIASSMLSQTLLTRSNGTARHSGTCILIHKHMRMCCLTVRLLAPLACVAFVLRGVQRMHSNLSRRTQASARMLPVLCSTGRHVGDRGGAPTLSSERTYFIRYLQQLFQIQVCPLPSTRW